jgi:hypothetical protein
VLRDDLDSGLPPPSRRCQSLIFGDGAHCEYSLTILSNWSFAAGCIDHLEGPEKPGALCLWPQIVPMLQSMPCSVDRLLNTRHVGAFSRENVHCPVCLEHFVEPIFDLNVSHMLAVGEGPDFLHRDAFKIVSGDEFFSHRDNS